MDSEESLDILINNAGLFLDFRSEKILTEDGNELTIQSNHLGHFLLTNLLMEKLEETPGHSALKLEKMCNFKSAKKHYLHFQNWQKINFCTRKKSEKFIFGSFILFTCAKIDFLPILKMQIMLFCPFEIAVFSNFRAL